MSRNTLPVNGDLSQAYILSLLVAGLMAGASLAGMISQDVFYPTHELRRTFLSNDVVNLIIGLPGLLAAMALTRRDRWIGLLVWPGALFYVTYTYIAYAIAASRPIQGFLYTALVILSAFTLLALFRSMNREAIHQRLSGKAPKRLAGWILLGLGTLFFLRSAWQLWSAQEFPPRTELGVLISDLLITPFWISGGILLLREYPLGTSSGLGLLFQASLLFVALLVFFLLQPFITGEPFPVTDFFVVLIMGMVCFIPCILYARGVLQNT